jgi:antitoxin (DNA-binding transcriptional repressor) of toxin-antitoxin stability system
MPLQLEISDLDVPMAEALKQVRRGEEVTISDNGHTIAKLVLVDPQERVFGAFEGRGEIADDFDAPLPPDLQAGFEK